MKSKLFGIIIVVVVCVIDNLQCQNHNRISRDRGNILRNITRTQAYVDNIVTSQLDASVPARQIYRTIRDIYNR